MPRASRVPAKLVTQKTTKLASNAPQLWNAKERIRTSVGLAYEDLTLLQRSPHRQFLKQLNRISATDSRYEQIYEKWLKLRQAEPTKGNWWQNDKSSVIQYMENHPQLSKVSEDVREFIASNPALREHELLSLLKDPVLYFSRPKNVPFEDRRQIYFPDPNDTVTLMRTSHLGPRYAAFAVPLHFNKLDMRDYLKSVYNVDVLHIRSTITQAKRRHKSTLSKRSYGQLVRAASRKKMTVLLAEPFVYPEEITDLSPWDHNDYWNSMLDQEKAHQSRGSFTEPNQEHRSSIRSQARQMVMNNTTSKTWKPTWHEMTASRRAMQGLVNPPQRAKPAPS